VTGCITALTSCRFPSNVPVQSPAYNLDGSSNTYAPVQHERHGNRFFSNIVHLKEVPNGGRGIALFILFQISNKIGDRKLFSLCG